MSVLLEGESIAADTAGPPQRRVSRARRGLFAKYFAFIVLLVSVGLLASGAIGLYFSYRETRQSLVDLQREKALTAAVRIEEFVRDIERQLGWTTLPQVAPAGAPMEQRRLDFLRLLRQVPAITEVAHLDASGREQLRVSRLVMDVAATGADYSREARFLVPREGRTWFGPVSFRKDTEPYMPIAIQEGRDRDGVTVVDVNLKFIWDVVSRLRIGRQGVAYVVDEHGLLVAHPDISLVLRKTDLSSLPQVREALAAKAEGLWKEPEQARDSEGRRVLSAYAVIAPTGWRVFVEEPESAVFAPLYGALTRTALLLLAGVLLSVAASIVLARRMVHPVRLLQEGAERIGAGDLTQRIEVRTGDELEELAGRFNTMTSQLADSYADLERKVMQRTAELRAALEQQTATGDILQVISRSPTDVTPVFRAIVESARVLGAARNAYAFRYDGERIAFVTSTDKREAWVEHARELQPWLPDRSTMTGRVVLARATVQIEDMCADPDYRSNEGVEDERALLGVPMLRDGEVIGVLTVTWATAGAVPEKFVRLLETFAAQAVIAVENVRLFNEIQEKGRQLEIANKHKSDFLASMSHELRTPLNAIIGFSDVMLAGMSGPLGEQQREFVGDIRDSGRHLLALINDILDLSKIEAGRMELDRSRFDLRGAIDNALTLVRGRADRGEVRLELRAPAALGEFEGDERKFKQVLLNLLSNAIKFTPAGGVVTLLVESVAEGRLFSVIDTGIGIAPEDQERIFEEFRQVGTDYARKAEGTGLGLTLTKRLVELHGGWLRVESAPGQGSTFTFLLPGAAA